uniref:Membrane protein YCF1 n=1 Tax=Catalpa bungei TaxID=265496 RepID=A0A142CCZ7_9LAMI|nr:membrane protein YCF1 [Catalpa bungei]
MDGYRGGGSFQDSSKFQDLRPFGANPTGDAIFDASQYEFFGGDVLEEVELGGLEDEEDDLAPAGFEEEEFQLEKEEGDLLGSLSEIDDLSSTFSKLNKVVSGPTSAGVSRDWGSRESSSAAELAQDADFTNWFDQRAFEAESVHESKKWSSHPYSSSARFMDPNSLHRTSSYPEPQQQHPQPPQNLQHHHSSEPILIPKSSFTSYPPSGGRSQQASPNGQSSQPDILYHQPFASSNHSSFSNTQLQLNVLPHGSQFGGNLPQLHHGLPVNSQLKNQWVNQNNLYPGNHSGLPNSFTPQQLSHQNGLMPPQMMPPHHSQQTRMQHPFQPSFGHSSGLQSQLFNPHLSPSPPMMNNYDMLGLPDLRDQRAISLLRSRQGMRYTHQGSDSGSQRSDSGWPRFKSKCMSADEIENILRMQLAATHSGDPYVEDYYYQARLSRKSAGAKLKHHFCPTNLRDSSSKDRPSNEPHAFLKVDALGRVSFPSIRRPRPLLEVDPPNSSGGGGGAESKLTDKPLEQEPMLAARVAIEDGICLLLDVDDIDRFLQFNHLPDSGAQLRQRRQVLLEGLASSLQLVDPLTNNGQSVNPAPEDDLVFLRIVSLPKGRKLLSRYLQLLLPGELNRVVCMAIFRNSRFLFGNLPADPGASAATSNLANTVSSCIHNMELKALAACLASVVCSVEHPPLRPIGNSMGDGASIILKSLLERATELLTDPNAAGNCTPHNRTFWQASFDAFFGLLTKYCFNKYDSVVQSFLSRGSPDASAVASDIAKAISREMPVELLRACLPHISEQQRRILLEFSQRSVPVPDFTGGGNGSS